MPTVSQHTASPAQITHGRASKDQPQIVSQLSRQLSSIRNEVSERAGCLSRLRKELSVLEAWQRQCSAIEQSHGRDTSIRAKADLAYGGISFRFKPCATGLFSAARYRAERSRASAIVDCESSPVSAQQARKEFDSRIASHVNRISEVDSALSSERVKLREIEAKLREAESSLRPMRDGSRMQGHMERKRGEEKTLFSNLYQTNIGCQNLNAQARLLYRKEGRGGVVNARQVIAEYERVHGSNVFTRGAKEIKQQIKFNGNTTSEVVELGANAFYRPSDREVRTFRGQEMTGGGIETVRKDFDHAKAHNTILVYRLGQFFSTSSDERVAASFAKSDQIRVIFDVIGNSGSGLDVSSGLSFQNHEDEILYSPFACFAVKTIGQEGATYRIQLSEVQRSDHYPLLPY